MNDLINRQAVLKGISLSCIGQSDVIKAEAALVRYVTKIPSAEPERKKGKWEIYDYGYDGEDEYPIIRCSECKYLPPKDMDAYNFCPKCGMGMRGGEDGETESH